MPEVTDKHTNPPLPKFVTVGGVDIAVGAMDASQVLRENVWGAAVRGESRVLVYQNPQDPLDGLDTLLHELAHIVVRQRGGCPGGEAEETLVTGVTSALVQILRDNPGLRGFINETCLRADARREQLQEGTTHG